MLTSSFVIKSFEYLYISNENFLRYLTKSDSINHKMRFQSMLLYFIIIPFFILKLDIFLYNKIFDFAEEYYSLDEIKMLQKDDIT